MTQAQTLPNQDPVTVHVRPMQAVLEQAAAICRECGVVTAISPDTTAKTLVEKCAAILNASGGEPAAVICYGGSDYGNSPRRTSAIDIFLLAAQTRVRPAMDAILAASWEIIGRLDDLVTQDVAGEWPITDKWKLRSDEAVDLGGTGAAAALLLAFDLEDY